MQKRLVVAAMLMAAMAPACSQQTAPTEEAPLEQAAATQLDIQPGVYRFDPTHVSVVARVLHQGFSHYTFRFDRVEGELNVSAEDVLASTLTVQLDPASVNTGLEEFDAEVVSFLGAQTTPQITFRSTRIERTGVQHGRVHGELTMNGQTRPLALDVTLNKSGPNMFGRQTMGFSVIGTIRRSEFGVATGLPFDDAADEIHLQIEAEMRRVEQAAPQAAPG